MLNCLVVDVGLLLLDMTSCVIVMVVSGPLSRL